MKDFSISFGPVISFILPGAVILWGISFHVDIVSNWSGDSENGLSASALVAGALASLGLGMLANGVRFLTVNKLLKRQDFYWSRLTESEATFKAFDTIVNNCWHYHLFYGNSLVAILAAAALYYFSPEGVTLSHKETWSAIVIVGLVAIMCLRAAISNGNDYYAIGAIILPSRKEDHGSKEKDGQKESQAKSKNEDCTKEK